MIKNITSIIIFFSLFSLLHSQEPGELLWTYKTQSPKSELAIGHNGDIYINDAKLHAVSPDGQLKWIYDIPEQIVSDEYTIDINAPLVSRDGTIYFNKRWNPGPHVWLTALDSSGRLKWDYLLGLPQDFGYASTATILSNNNVVIAISKSCNELLQFSPDGTVVQSDTLMDYQYETKRNIISDKDHIYFALQYYVNEVFENGYLFKFDAKFNEPWVKQDVGYKNYGAITWALDQNLQLYMTTSTWKWVNNFPQEIHELLCYDSTGNIKWSSVGEFESIVIDKYFTVFTCQKDTLYSFSPDGPLQWKYKLPSPLTSGLLIGDAGVLYFSCLDKTINAFSILNQKTIWSFQCSEVIKKSLTMDHNGNLYAIDEQGTLYALKTNSNGLDNHNWPKFQHDAQNTGHLNSTSSDVDYNSMPNSCLLHQNYPNPFNPLTTIRFSLPKKERVLLKVYNMAGQLVDILVNDIMTAGEHNVLFDGTSLPSGLYFAVFKSETYIKSQKMVLVK